MPESPQSLYKHQFLRLKTTNENQFNIRYWLENIHDGEKKKEQEGSMVQLFRM